MATIWKFPFRINDTVLLDMPRNARVLSVQLQHDVPCLWALVNPANRDEQRTFRIRGTGHSHDDDGGQFIGTIQMAGGNLVWHVFEAGPE